MKKTQFFLIIDIVCIAIAFFFPNEVYGWGMAVINGFWLFGAFLAELAKHEDKRRHLDEIDLIF